MAMYPVEIPIAEMNSFDLPPMCLITGAKDNVEFKKVNYAWYPRWIVIFVLGLLLVALILAAVLTKRAKGQLPFNARAYRNWKIGQSVFAVAVLFSLIMLIPGLGLAFAGDNAKAMAVGWALLAAALAIPVGTWYGLLHGKHITVRKIDNTTLTIGVPKLEVALAFKQHLTGGRRAPAGLPPAMLAAPALGAPPTLLP